MLTTARMREWGLDLAVLLAGLSVPLAFAPFGFAYLVYPALIVLLSAWRISSPARAFVRGYLFGFGLFGFGLYWVHISINLFGGVNLLLSFALTYLLVAFLALYPAATGWLWRRGFPNQSLTALILAPAALWALVEWLRSWLVTGFPWLSLGYTQLETPLAGYIPILGIYGVSGVIVLLVGLLLAAMQCGCRQRIFAISMVAIILIGGAGLKQVQWTTPKSAPLQAVLVQGAVPQALKWKPQQLRQTMNLYRDLTRPYWGQADIIVWPETAIPAYAYQIEDYLDDMRQQSIDSGTPLVLGLVTVDPDRGAYYNSILSIGKSEDIYHKRHLVPFGEYLPLKVLLDPLLALLQIPMSDFASGNADQPLLDLGAITAGVSICYEDIFGAQVIEALPQAEVLINISNDAWYGDSIAPHQHLQMARARALEAGRYLLRATNTGISAVINAQGSITAISPQFKPDALVAEIRLRSGLTPYARFGNGGVVILGLLSLFIVIYCNKHKRNRNKI